MGVPSFRVAGKIFAQLSDAEHVVLLKVSIVDQDALRAAKGEDVWLPAHWGKFGWTYVRIASFASDELETYLAKSWTNVAPKALVARERS